MSGETDLAVLLRDMRAKLDEKAYGYYSLNASEYEQLAVTLVPLGLFREDEGITLIVEQTVAAAAGLPAGDHWARIVLTVHSALSAVGLTAAVATQLSALGISCNVVAAYYHDHLFVPWPRRLEALAALQDLSARAAAR